MISPYYQYEFTSAEPLIAQIKEELKSYLDTGAVDDVLWSRYVDKCLSNLGKGMMQISSLVLDICNYEARLPDNFDSVREAWLCTNDTDSYQLPGADYQQVKMQATSTRLDSTYSYCAPCEDCCHPQTIKAIYKTTHEVFAYYQKQYLLQPGSVETRGRCHSSCSNLGASSTDTFDIVGNKFRTNFTTGNVYLLFYSKEYDPSGYQMIPDNSKIQDYIELFIKAKVFEQLSNQVVDETYNQIQGKAQNYQARADEAFIKADIETKKETIYDKYRKALKTKNRHNKYLIR